MIYQFFQPNVDQAVISGADFVRISQYSASGGDIYESTQSSHAIAVGPLSDFANYNVAYFDRQASPTFLSQIAVGPGRPFTGLIAARNQQQFSPAQRPSRTLIYPTDIWQEDYLPAGYNPVQDLLYFEPPVVDIIQYFTPVNPTTKRIDKTYEYGTFGFGIDDVYVLIPCYDRRLASLKFTNDTDQAITITVRGLKWALREGGPQISELVAATAVSAGAALAEKVINSPTAGLFDYLEIQLDPASAPSSGTCPLRVTVSDTNAGT